MLALDPLSELGLDGLLSLDSVDWVLDELELLGLLWLSALRLLCVLELELWLSALRLL